MIKNMDMVYLNGLIVVNIEENGKMESNMVLEYIEMIKDRNEKENGLKVRDQNGQDQFWMFLNRMMK